MEQTEEEKPHASPSTASTNLPSETDKRGGLFSSRWAFWVAAIGCSVGYGNLWRFPFLIWTQGGGAFFIPYLLSLFIVAIPVSMLEFGVGQLSQGGQVKAFAAIDKRVASVGFFVITCFTMLYYPLLRSFAILFFGHSFKKDLPWIVSPAEEAACTAALSSLECLNMDYCIWTDDTCSKYALGKAKTFFERRLHAKPEYWEGVNHWNWEVLLVETGMWILTCLGTLWGTRILGYINYFLIAGPAIFLLVQVGVGCSLPGASIGLKQYLGKFELDRLKDTTVWSNAASQGLLSLGATQGSMVAYSSHNKREQNFVQDVYVVAIGDTLFAIIAGLAIFAVAGFMADSSGIPLDELPLSGRALVFQTYPVGMGEGIPYPGAQIVSVMFFLTLWLLGMSTFIGQLEAVCLVIHESKFWRSKPFLKRWHSYVAMCGFLWLFSFLDATDMGIHIMDCLDEFAAVFGYTFVGGCESIAAGWFSAWNLYKKKAGLTSIMIHMTTYIFGFAIGACVGFGAPTEVGRIAGPVIGAVIVIGGFAVALPLTLKANADTGEPYSWLERLNHLTMYNINQLRRYMNDIACRNQCCCKVPWIWSLTLKYIVPPLLTIVFFLSITNPYQTYRLPASPDSGDPAYPWWVFVLGNVAPYGGFIGVILFFFIPSWMDWLCPEDEFQFIYPDEDLSRSLLPDKMAEGQVAVPEPSVSKAPSASPPLHDEAVVTPQTAAQLTDEESPMTITPESGNSE